MATPQAGSNSFITTGGTAVVAVPANASGGYITNPYSAADQNIPTAEWLYVNPVSSAILGSYGTTSGLAPGSSFNIIAGTTIATTVNAATSNHRFTVVWYP